jgi:hypothetical protein
VHANQESDQDWNKVQVSNTRAIYKNPHQCRRSLGQIPDVIGSHTLMRIMCIMLNVEHKNKDIHDVCPPSYYLIML